MKQTFIILISLLALISLYDHFVSSRNSVALENANPIPAKQPLDLFFLQDCSVSAQPSIAFASSKTFDLLFISTDRDIRIGFLCITAHTTQPPVFVTLPAKRFVAPQVPDLATLSITERKREKRRFALETAQYQSDSSRYYTERSARITQFTTTVDSLLSRYREHYTGETDLVSAVSTADNSFNYGNTNARRLILINGDGKDSYGRVYTRLHNQAEVILITAGRNSGSSIDSIITTTFTTVEQAINYSLKTSQHEFL